MQNEVSIKKVTPPTYYQLEIPVNVEFHIFVYNLFKPRCEPRKPKLFRNIW